MASWTNYWSGHGRTGRTGDYALERYYPSFSRRSETMSQTRSDYLHPATLFEERKKVGCLPR